MFPLSLKVKMVGYAGLVLIVCLTLYSIHSHIYNKGYDAAVEVYEEALRVERAKEKAIEDKSTSSTTDTRIEYIIKTKEIEKRVPIYVEKTKEILHDVDCSLPDSYYRLHDEQVDSINNAITAKRNDGTSTLDAENR